MDESKLGLLLETLLIHLRAGRTDEAGLENVASSPLQSSGVATHLSPCTFTDTDLDFKRSTALWFCFDLVMCFRSLYTCTSFCWPSTCLCMSMHEDSAINHARQKVSWSQNFDQSVDVYCRAFGFHTSACYLQCQMPGTQSSNQQPVDKILSQMT